MILGSTTKVLGQNNIFIEKNIDFNLLCKYTFNVTFKIKIIVVRFYFYIKIIVIKV